MYEYAEDIKITLKRKCGNLAKRPAKPTMFWWVPGVSKRSLSAGRRRRHSTHAARGLWSGARNRRFRAPKAEYMDAESWGVRICVILRLIIRRINPQIIWMICGSMISIGESPS